MGNLFPAPGARLLAERALHLPESPTMTQGPPRDDSRYARIYHVLSAAVVLTLSLTILKVAFPFALRERPMDLATFWVAARVVWSDGASPYAPSKPFADLGASLDQTVYPFLYPPPSLLVFAPLSATSYADARAAVAWINLALYALVVGLLIGPILAPRRSQLPRWAIALTLVLLTSFQPIAHTIGHGQVNLLVLGAILLAWIGARRRMGPLVGLSLTVAVALKVYPALLLVPLAARREWRLVCWTLGCFAAAVLASVLLLPAATWDDWLLEIVPSGGYLRAPADSIPASASGNLSINGFVARALTANPTCSPLVEAPIVALLLVWTLVLGAITAYVAACVRAARSGAATLDLELALALLSSFLVAPLSWNHHLVFVMPAVVVLIRGFVTAPPRLGVLVPMALAISLIAGPLEPPIPSRGARLAGLTLSLKLYAVCLLWGYALITLWRAGQQDRRH
jgi:alpha-1,2-mannosyltransferase